MAMRAALAAHDEVLRGAIEAHDGFMFKHTGDGVCAAFASPRLRSMRRWMRSGRWSCRCGWGWRPARPSCARVDYFGAVLNRAARVLAAGHGGQILLDGTTAGLCSSIDLIALGPRRLRDIAKPVEMFQVLAVGLRREFPPLEDARRDTGKPAPSNDELSSDGSPNWPRCKRR